MGRRNKRQSNSSYELVKRENVVLDEYGMSFVINTGIWLVSLDCLNTMIIDEICDRNVVADIIGQVHLHAAIEEVEEMLRTTCHIVIKALVKFTLIGLRHDRHVY